MTDRRGNGLLADAYVPLILLTPLLADTMLEALGRAGIAAYAVPLDEDVLDPDRAPGEQSSTDHLYVDANERRAAEEVLRAELPELVDPPGAGAAAPPDDPASSEQGRSSSDDEDDEVWADLVARFYDTDEGGREWPDAENVSGHAGGDLLDTPEPDEPPAPRLRPIRPRPPEERSAHGLDDGEHFVPPPPPPLPRGDLTSRAAWAGLLGGPAVLLVSTILGFSVPGWLVLAVLCAFVAGFVVLLIRMGDRPPRDSGPDDGAII
ncbi:hypothetical protein [Actinorugispora endophytica]|uniref:DUF308 domain-containing protein n=1 Tax=Actinorugispora endophytica TaxID=1605990 RepID=A0A4R6V252_9ACTN|nr:hypothetical protein [Actinorugispora endophytica]TDQ52515.1 hypothetical protein EV190_106153 [Actinorugispora endophytica]